MNSDVEQKPEKEQKIKYLEGLKVYKSRGIPIYIDDEETAEDQWSKIFEAHEDGSFYMGDYIGADTGKLTEIRFEKVYYR